MRIALIVGGFILAVIAQAAIWLSVSTPILAPAVHVRVSQAARYGFALEFVIGLLVGTIANLVIGIGAAGLARRRPL